MAAAAGGLATSAGLLEDLLLHTVKCACLAPHKDLILEENSRMCVA
jgi:hypothetical protein